MPPPGRLLCLRCGPAPPLAPAAARACTPLHPTNQPTSTCLTHSCAASHSHALFRRFFDPGLGNRGLRRMQRRPRASLTFVEEGKLQKQAEIGRLRVRPPPPARGRSACTAVP